MTRTTHDTAGLLTPAEMSERTGVSIDTLRYYEREGLLADVARADSGHRRYSVDDVLWVEVLRCLRDTGMTIEQLRYYCDLGAQGDHTEPERLRLLLDHRAKVEQQIAERHAALELIDHKVSFYLAAQTRPARTAADATETGHDATCHTGTDVGTDTGTGTGTGSGTGVGFDHAGIAHAGIDQEVTS